jgi:hypothetical protein
MYIYIHLCSPVVTTDVTSERTSYVRIRQHTSAYVSIPIVEDDVIVERAITCLIPSYFFLRAPIGSAAPL